VYGLIAKITIAEGKRGEMIDILKASAAAIPGCHRYVIAKDAADANVVWVTEVWDSQTSHDSSVALPAVQAAIPRARAIAFRSAVLGSAPARLKRRVSFACTLPCQRSTLPRREDLGPAMVIRSKRPPRHSPTR
jgi:quinol monooxygenase YgiN